MGKIQSRAVETERRAAAECNLQHKQQPGVELLFFINGTQTHDTELNNRNNVSSTLNYGNPALSARSKHIVVCFTHDEMINQCVRFASLIL